MKFLNGFKKLYFSLASIQAHSCAQKLHNKIILFKLLLTNVMQSSNEEDTEDDPPTLTEILLCTYVNTTKPCHCDCLFKRKTRLAISLFKFIPRCPFYCTFFAFRRTGTHPPLSF